MKEINSIKDQYEIIIIGAGMAGLSCASALAKIGIRDVLLIEANTVSHRNSSSFGQSRMFREMYSDPQLCQLSKHSNKLWREDESLSNKKLQNHHGLLFYGESWDEETIEGSIPGAKKVMREQNIPFEELDYKKINERFPLKAKEHFTGLFEPMAGSINCEDAIDFWMNNAFKHGHHLIENTKVESIHSENGLVNLKDTSIKCDQIILTAGMWTNKLLESIGHSLNYKIWPMLWGHYEVEEIYASKYPQWFCFQKAKGIDGGLYYGFPVLSFTPDGTPLIKVGLDWTLSELSLEDSDLFPSIPPDKLVDSLDEFIYKNIKGVKKRFDMFLSPYSMTRDVNFILDRLSDNICVFSGGSGQAYKFAPLIGESLANLAIKNVPLADISCWSKDRFTLN
tara:strand:+ start:8180 stop:9364 length:1185 start_codon:yes stop_codon:yes gene_type:complete